MRIGEPELDAAAILRLTQQGALDRDTPRAQFAADGVLAFRAKSVHTGKGGAPAATLLDRDSKVGKLYGAVTTPHMSVIDPKGTLVYVGAIDDYTWTNTLEPLVKQLEAET